MKLNHYDKDQVLINRCHKEGKKNTKIFGGAYTQEVILKNK